MRETRRRFLRHNKGSSAAADILFVFEMGIDSVSRKRHQKTVQDYWVNPALLGQGSITSPQIFNIFINALLCMLTVTGQNEDISHGLQIGKDQKGDNSEMKTIINSTT